MSVSPLQALSADKSFFELMRQVERFSQQIDTEKASKTGLYSRGYRRRPTWLKLEQDAKLSFAASEVSAVNLNYPDFGDDDQFELQVGYRHFGLFAPYGPMPLHITEHGLYEKGFVSFLNMLSANLAWLHYVAWSAMHPVLASERADNVFVKRVTSLGNALSQSQVLAETDRHAHACRRSFPGLYLSRQRPLPALQRLLQNYFGIPLQVKPRNGRWLPVPNVDGTQNQLGLWRLGARVWDAQLAFEILIGPIDGAEFKTWQKRAKALRALVSIVNDYAEGQLEPVVKVLVNTRPELAGRIGKMQIGVDSWLHPTYQLKTLTVHEPFQESL